MTHPIWKRVAELENRQGRLYFDGCSAEELAREFGTPLYVYSENRIRANYRRLIEAYRREYPRFEAYYAVKANNNPAILRLLASEGAGADVACVNEIRMARAAGISSEKILYSGALYWTKNNFILCNRLLLNT